VDSPDAFLKRAVEFNPLRDPRILRRSLYYNLRQLPNGKWTWKHDTRLEAQIGDIIWRRRRTAPRSCGTPSQKSSARPWLCAAR
jgi:hypothetical protein